MNPFEELDAIVDKFHRDCDRFIERMKIYDELNCEPTNLKNNRYGNNDTRRAAQEHVEQ